MPDFIINHKSSIINHRRGFTLIELLVVIGIIGVLATLLMANFGGIRQRARDAQRKSDLRQIQAALELYRSDNGTYPTTTIWPSACPASNSLTATVGGTTVTYMKKVPCDPLSSNPAYTYTYDSVSSTYTLKSCLENVNDPEKDATNTCSSGLASFTVQTP